MSYKICIFTGTRAEFGLLYPLIKRLERNDLFETFVIVSGSHLDNHFGHTADEIIGSVNNTICIPILEENDTKVGVGVATGKAVIRYTECLEKENPDMLIVLGDRYEALAVAISAHILGIPVAHISGGDITEGAIDDSIRHCITKLSYLHFPGCEDSRRRIIQLGESSDRVFNVGELGIENCLHLCLPDREELQRITGIPDIKNDYCVVTFHPETMDGNFDDEQMFQLIEAMKEFREMAYIVTMSNADAGGRRINQIWLSECEKQNNWYVVSSLGTINYLASVKYCKMVIGNSSSGVIEAPVMKVPTINIGDRQKGRMIASSVICCKLNKEEIVNSMKIALDETFKSKCLNAKVPYGNGNTSEKIESVIIDFLNCGKIDLKKGFFDIKLSGEDL